MLKRDTNTNDDNKSDNNDNNNQKFIFLIQLAELDSKMQYFPAMHDCSCLFLIVIYIATNHIFSPLFQTV